RAPGGSTESSGLTLSLRQHPPKLGPAARGCKAKPAPLGAFPASPCGTDLAGRAAAAARRSGSAGSCGSAPCAPPACSAACSCGRSSCTCRAC
ncbi:hypothetical protein FK518_30840, partial [Klebsiella pneumoniae]|nr:hypothetical protein [Klebsiella pneumoniae]